MPDETLLSDRKVAQQNREFKNAAMGTVDGYQVTLTCGHRFWSPTEVTWGRPLKCAQCVNEFLRLWKEETVKASSV